jgi:hypothetical protein
MESEKFGNRKKLDYEKPKIKEEIVLEQKALACAVGVVPLGGGNFDCTKSNPRTHGMMTS